MEIFAGLASILLHALHGCAEPLAIIEETDGDARYCAGILLRDYYLEITYVKGGNKRLFFRLREGTSSGSLFRKTLRGLIAADKQITS